MFLITLNKTGNHKQFLLLKQYSIALACQDQGSVPRECNIYILNALQDTLDKSVNYA